jgi:hypothetical protein
MSGVSLKPDKRAHKKAKDIYMTITMITNTMSTNSNNDDDSVLVPSTHSLGSTRHRVV